jgi:hypothetical protein
MLTTWTHCKEPLNCTRKGEKASVRRVLNCQITLPKVRHLEVSLQWPTTVRKKLGILQMEEEITTLLTLKLIVLTSFPWRKRENKL